MTLSLGEYWNGYAGNKFTIVFIVRDQLVVSQLVVSV